MYELKPIGVVHSPFKHRGDVPLRDYQDAVGEIEIFKEYEEGLKDVEGFSHIVVLWIFHESEGYSLLVEPLAYKGGVRGVFATSHPDRPNYIGVTVVELLQRKDNMLKIKGVDMADGSPVVDIKPCGLKYCKKDIRQGWIETAKWKNTYNDKRQNDYSRGSCIEIYNRKKIHRVRRCYTSILFFKMEDGVTY